MASKWILDWLSDRWIACIILMGCLLGIVGFTKPADLAVMSARSIVDPIKPGGDIVVVGVDRKALQSVGSWPWDRRRYAEIVDTLDRSGAKVVVLDFDLTAGGTAAGNRSLLDAIRAAKAEVYLFAADQYRSGQADGDAYPKGDLSQVQNFASGEAKIGAGSVVYTLNRSDDVGGRSIPSIASILAGDAKGFGRFAINYGVSADQVPYLSAAEVLNGNHPYLKGKTVIVGANDASLGDVVVVPWQKARSGAYVNAVAGETLKRGAPVDIGWLPGLLIAVGLSLLAFKSGRKGLNVMILMSGFVILAISPFWMTYLNFVGEGCVGAMVLGGLSVRNRILKAKSEIMQDDSSGLQNLRAAFEAGVARHDVMVLLQIKNMRSIAEAFGQVGVRAMWKGMADRMRVLHSGAVIYHVGDCFVWGEDDVDAQELVERMKMLHQILRMPVLVDGVRCEPRIGFGIDLHKGSDLVTRMGAVQSLMEKSNERVVVRSNIDNDDALLEVSMSSEIDEGLKNGDFFVVYHPQYDRSKQIRGVEALLRWRHPVRGMISPEFFIPFAERSGSIEELTRYVVETVCRDMSKATSVNDLVTFSVNLSPMLFGLVDVSLVVAEACQKYGVPSRRLVMEITESGSLETISGAPAELQKLRLLGVGISCDDYGTKHSNLDNLRAESFSELKIDRRFVTNMDQSQADRVMVGNTIALAKSLGMTVVAEGVETIDVFEELAAMKCDLMQGYYFTKPVKFDDFHKLIDTRRDAHAA